MLQSVQKMVQSDAKGCVQRRMQSVTKCLKYGAKCCKGGCKGGCKVCKAVDKSRRGQEYHEVQACNLHFCATAYHTIRVMDACRINVED